MSAAWKDCSWFHSCVSADDLNNHPQTFMTTAVTPQLPAEPLPTVLPRIPPSWHNTMREGRAARRHELNSTVFRSLRQLRGSSWFRYLDAIYGVSSLTFPFALSHLEFFWVDKPLPRHFYDRALPSHMGQVALGDFTFWTREQVGNRENPSLGDVFELAEGPPNSLFVYLFPAMAGIHGASGRGRIIVPFRYDRGFPNDAKVEGVHKGWSERSGGCGYWLYLARGSGIYLALGQTMVFAEQIDALDFFTGCEAAGNCSTYENKKPMIIDGHQVLDRPFRREIYVRARARGLDTLQFTHRSESMYRFEIVDLRVPDGKVTDSCGYRPALSAGWRGTRPCACDPRKEALNCDRRGATALRAAARLQGFSEDLPVKQLRRENGKRRGSSRAKKQGTSLGGRRLKQLHTAGRDTARRGAPSLSLRNETRAWLAAARPGFCGETEPDVRGDCRADAYGSWGLRRADAVNWRMAAKACVPLCMACANCRYVTISLAHRDCSWFSECSLGRLPSYVSGFRSAQVRTEPMVLPRPEPSIHQPPQTATDAEPWPPCRIYVHDPGPHTNKHWMHRRDQRWSDPDDYFQVAFWLHQALQGYAGRTDDPAAADVIFVAHYFHVHLPRSIVYAGGPLGQWDTQLAKGGPSGLLDDDGPLLKRWMARPADFAIALAMNSPACGHFPKWLRGARWIVLERVWRECRYRDGFDIIGAPVVSRADWLPMRLVPAEHKSHFLTYVGRIGKPYIYPPACQLRLKMWAALRGHPNATFLATDYYEAVVPSLWDSQVRCKQCGFDCKRCLDPSVYALPAGSRTGVSPRLGSLAEYQAFFLNSTFCLMMRGDLELSLKFSEMILAGCIPVLIADMPAWPFARRLDYRAFSYEFDWRQASAQPTSIVDWLLRVSTHELAAKRAALMRVRGRFFFHADAQRQGATREIIKDLCNRPADDGSSPPDPDKLYADRPKDGHAYS